MGRMWKRAVQVGHFLARSSGQCEAETVASSVGCPNLQVSRVTKIEVRSFEVTETHLADSLRIPWTRPSVVSAGASTKVNKQVIVTRNLRLVGTNQKMCSPVRLAVVGQVATKRQYSSW